MKIKIIILLILSLNSLMWADFTRDDINGIVTDHNTTLQWQDDSETPYLNWSQAISYCEALSLGGYQDWRLPNLNEFYTIVNVSVLPPIDPVFQNTVSTYYWASTTRASLTSYGLGILFSDGRSGWSGKWTSAYVRCVRGEN